MNPLTTALMIPALQFSKHRCPAQPELRRAELEGLHHLLEANQRRLHQARGENLYQKRKPRASASESASEFFAVYTG